MMSKKQLSQRINDLYEVVLKLQTEVWEANTRAQVAQTALDRHSGPASSPIHLPDAALARRVAALEAVMLDHHDPVDVWDYGRDSAGATGRFTARITVARICVYKGRLPDGRRIEEHRSPADAASRYIVLPPAETDEERQRG